MTKNTKIKFPASRVKREVPIWVGKGLASSVAGFSKDPKFWHALVLFDRKVQASALKLEIELKANGYKVSKIGVQATEKLKSWEEVGTLIAQMKNLGVDRNTVLFALGGGVVGDVGGFIAGIYMRGIPWVSLPTTLLAMVDSSIGGKTGVNTAHGKNIAGLFHQPLLTAIDLDFLSTLPEREWISGMGEVLKTALSCDPKFARALPKILPRLSQGDLESWEQVIFRCAGIKAEIVSLDETDVLGIREILNFGHTVAHAIESLTKYTKYRHGEAVILGMRIESRISFGMGFLSGKDAMELERILSAFPVPELPKGITPEKIWNAMKGDKKNHAGQIRMVLLRGLGSAFSSSEVRLNHLISAMQGQDE